MSHAHEISILIFTVALAVFIVVAIVLNTVRQVRLRRALKRAQVVLREAEKCVDTQAQQR